MADRWAVVVVHGVGDTGPGVTVDTFLSSLTPQRPRLSPDGKVEVHLLPDMQPPGKPPAPGTTNALNATFPMHVRRAAILAPSTGPVGGPVEAVFAEVFWADLSTLREGTIYLILGLLSTIFSLRYLADQAAVMPPEDPAAKWPEKLARLAARWLRFILHGAAALLCGPIAGLAALLACVVAGDTLVYPILTKLIASRETFEVILSALAGLGTLAWAHGARQTSTTTWTRFWFGFGLAAIAGSVTVTWARSAGFSGPLWGYVKHLVGLQLGATADISRYAAGIFFVLQVAYLVMVALMLAGLIAFAIAFTLAPRPWRPALGAALGASIVQVGLWLVIVPPLIMLGLGTVRPSHATLEALAPLLANIRFRFGVQLLLTLVVAVIALGVLVSRVLWARSWLERTKTPPPYAYPTLPPDIRRLLVNAAVVGGIIVMATLGGTLFVREFFAGLPRTIRVFGIDLIALANLISSLSITILLFVAARFAQDLRAGLHVLTDVINHFFRRHDAIPWPWGKETPAHVSVFETQQRIEHRFKAVLDAVLADNDVTHLTIVSHSQGTMIAIDVFSLTGLSPAFRAKMTTRLGRLAEFHLITMGSPLTHLYEHYFPFRYPPLASHSWGGLRVTVKNWINVYRVDDYVGTFITPVPTWRNASGTADVLLNMPIDPGGHVGYWRQPAVFSLSPIKEVLPGA
jgi:hypothetical protein